MRILNPRLGMKTLYLALLIIIATFGCAFKNDSPQTGETTQGTETSALSQVQSIELPNVEGRIDHMAIDQEGGRLFVAALGNNTVEVIDLKASTPTDEIKGMKGPQGVVYVPEADKLLVSNGVGSTLDIYDGHGASRPRFVLLTES